ncbi:PKD domain-containing protein [Streptomyces sp. NPDC052236]|uniref:PKD domain-containing protein n=1 Tax=Streptomyces sp. NPDC052236 TaxID=3365686 RepID=UPI0037D073B1
MPVILAATVSGTSQSAVQADPVAQADGLWVAMGDSYQAGVGTNTYDSSSGKCQRSPLSHARLIDTDGTLRDTNGAKIPLLHAACSGAVTADIYAGKNGEPPQIDRISSGVSHVTIGVTGNDMGFGDVVKYCATHLRRECAKDKEPELQERLAKLQERNQPGDLNRLEGIFFDIFDRAPGAKVFALTYPRFFPVGGGEDGTSLFLPRAKRCSLIHLSDQLWINNWVRRLNDYIVAAAVATPGVVPVDIQEISDGHELCSGVPEDQQHLNKVRPRNRLQDSFHPTKWGYEATALRLKEDLCAPQAPSTLGGDPSPARLTRDVTVRPGQTTTVPVTLAGGPAVAFQAAWDNGDVTMTLRAPSEQAATVPPAGARQVRTPDGFSLDSRSVRTPAAGRWTIELQGTGSAEQKVRVAVTETAKPNAAPTAHMDVRQSGTTITLDATRSSDDDGRISTYLWEFGDGTVLEGKKVSRPLSAAGMSGLTLTVIDDRGDLDVAALQPSS